MRITWGHKIVLAFIAFGVFILYMVFKMANSKVDLVEKDYYAQEIKFQEKIEKYNNMQALGDNAVTITQNSQQVKIDIKNSLPKYVSVLFYYPINNQFDTLFRFNNSQSIVIDKKYLHKGRSKIKLEWKDDSKEYYYEKEILID